MKILIIGSKGFIGSHCNRYFSDKAEVWECDVVTDYVSPRYFIVDATNADYSNIFQANKYDVCINCSGAASVPDSLINPQRDFFLNTVTVFKLLDAIRKYNSNCKFLNISSAAVYGNPESLPVKESQAIKPLSPYGFHKKTAEDICAEFTTHYQINTCNIRIFSAYGNGLTKQIFWDLYKKTKNSDTLELFGTGNESRDFIHVDDLVQQIHLITERSAFKGEVVNSANGKQIFIRDAVNTFIKQLAWTGKIQFMGAPRQGDPLNWEADISTLKKFGYKQQVPFEEGIKRYIKWLKESK